MQPHGPIIVNGSQTRADGGVIFATGPYDEPLTENVPSCSIYSTETTRYATGRAASRPSTSSPAVAPSIARPTGDAADSRPAAGVGLERADERVRLGLAVDLDRHARADVRAGALPTGPRR